MSAVDNLNEQQFGYHVSPKTFKPGDMVAPRSSTGASPGIWGDPSYAYATPSLDRAEQYHYMLWEQGIRNHHIYSVEPTGKIEQDPNDEDAVRSRSGFRVLGQEDED